MILDRKYLYLILSFSIVFLSYVISIENCKKNSGEFCNIIENSRLINGSSMTKSNTFWATPCLLHCLQDLKCKSVSHSETQRVCTLHYDAIYENGATLEAVAGWNFYQFDNKSGRVSSDEQRYYSCKDALLLNNFKSGFYTIHPTVKQLTACCYMSNGKYMTEVTHDWNKETYVVNKTFDCPAPMPSIKYDGVNDIKSLISLVNLSDRCEQHVKIRCLNAQTYVNKGRTNACMGVRDRNGKHTGYWGGGNREKYCACGVNGTCYDPQKECNCESTTTAIEQMDEGTYTDKNILPITSVAPGDTDGSSEKQYYTIGNLICSMN